MHYFLHPLLSITCTLCNKYSILYIVIPLCLCLLIPPEGVPTNISSHVTYPSQHNLHPSDDVFPLFIWTHISCKPHIKIILNIMSSQLHVFLQLKWSHLGKLTQSSTCPKTRSRNPKKSKKSHHLQVGYLVFMKKEDLNTWTIGHPHIQYDFGHGTEMQINIAPQTTA
jgi:hypothetical protein